MVAFGQLAVANHDLPIKFEKGIPLNSIRNGPPAEMAKLLYGPGPVKEGYTDLTPYYPK